MTKISPTKFNMHVVGGIIGELNIWWFTIKMQLVRYLIGDFEKETHAYSLYKWRPFNLPIFTCFTKPPN